MDKSHGMHDSLMKGADSSPMGTLGKGAAIGMGVKAGQNLIGRMASSPWLVFGLGVAVGFLALKYNNQRPGMRSDPENSNTTKES